MKAPQRLKKATKVCVVLVTAPDVKTGRRLAQAALEARLVACVNLVPGVESHYWWQDQLEKGSEVLMILKTTKRLLPALRDLILAAHPYDTPEFVALPVDRVAERYLAWWEASATPSAGAGSSRTHATSRKAGKPPRNEEIGSAPSSSLGGKHAG